MKSQGLTFDELYDTVGVRIIVATIPKCYEVLGIIHSYFNPVVGRFKDYVAMPKSNMYQSLHTTVIGPEGKAVEIQIKTIKMDEISQTGIASHWRYKEGKNNKSQDVDFGWLRQIIDLQKEKETPKDFLANLKLDLFIDEVFVFTSLAMIEVLDSVKEIPG